MPCFTYVLRSERTGRRYTGSCADIALRLEQHNAGHSTSTRHGVPWTLIHCEEFPDRASAYARERFLKTGKGRQELERLLEAATT